MQGMQHNNFAFSPFLLWLKSFHAASTDHSLIHTLFSKCTYLEKVIFCTIFEKGIIHGCPCHLFIYLCSFWILFQLCCILGYFQQTFVGRTEKKNNNKTNNVYVILQRMYSWMSKPQSNQITKLFRTHATAVWLLGIHIVFQLKSWVNSGE